MAKKAKKSGSQRILDRHWPEFHAAWSGVQLKTYEEYVQTIGRALKAEGQRVDRRIKKELAGLEGEELHEREQWYYLHKKELASAFPAMCYKSLFVMIYSFLEDELVSWCRKIREVKKILLDVEEIGGGDYLERSVLYLKKVAKIKFPNDRSEWQQIRTFQFIRNKIVHHRGLLLNKGQKEDEKFKERKAYILSKNGKVSENNYVTLSEQICLHAIKVVQTFLHQLAEVTPSAAKRKLGRT